MRQSVIGGAALAAAVALLVLLSDPLSLEIEHLALLGVGIGAALGLVRDRMAWERIAGFGAGLALTWLGYALRAAVLPDAPSGRAVGFAALILVLMVITWASTGRLPLWAMLLGMAAVAGAYESAFIESPARFLTESPVVVTSVLLAVAVGFAIAALVDLVPDQEGQGRHREGSGGIDEAVSVPLDDMLHTDEEVRP